jgi:type III secretion protein F
MAINSIPGSGGPSIKAGPAASSDGGMDLLTVADALKGPSINVAEKIARIQADSNLTDTERMMDMQVALNTMSTITNLRTNMIKVVSDTLKAIVRNIA